VVDAIADGKKAASMIERYLKNEPLLQPVTPRLPEIYIESKEGEVEDLQAGRVETPRAPAEWRKRNFAEVEVALSGDEARREASRCLRCDLEFTAPQEDRNAVLDTRRHTA
jgi:NADH-quinone oxidoreductase subunit F